MTEVDRAPKENNDGAVSGVLEACHFSSIDSMTKEVTLFRAVINSSGMCEIRHL